MLLTASTYLLADPAQLDQSRTLAEERTETRPNGDVVKIRVYENSANQRVAASVEVRIGKWRVYSLFLPAIIMGAGFILFSLLSLVNLIHFTLVHFFALLLLIPIMSGIVMYGNLLMMKAQVKLWTKKKARAILDGEQDNS